MVAAVGIRAPEGRVLALTGEIPSTGIRVPEGRVLATVRQAAHDVDVFQLFGMVTYNIPSEQMNSTAGRIFATFRQAADIDVTQARIMVLARGRISNPKIRAWRCKLDGHDFYVLRLGDRGTLVYDRYSKQWMDWRSFEQVFWRLNCGQNWVGAAALAPEYGSDIIAGDDTFGLLWFLDPNQAYDEHPDYLNYQQELFFERVTMGQVAMKGRENLPCYAVWLTTDMGNPAYTGAGVTLFLSDDAGEEYFDAGTVEVVAGEKRPQLQWDSLGQIEAPGRLFKIVDDGAIARIDGMEMNDPDDDD